VESRLLETGEMEVHETISYRMRKPFRGVFREIPPARYEVMEGVNLWTEDLETQEVELTPLPRGGFSARVWLVPREVFERESPHPYFYHPRIYLMGSNFYGLHTVAASTIARSQARSHSGGFGRGGFSGGAGGFGGGSGGGRGGAF